MRGSKAFFSGGSSRCRCSTCGQPIGDQFASHDEAEMALFDDIEVFYNNGVGIRRSNESVPRRMNGGLKRRN